MNRRFTFFTVFSRKTSSTVVALALAALAIAGIVTARGQDETMHLKLHFAVHPLQNPDFDAIQAASDTGAGLKVFTYHVTSTRQGSKGQKFTGMMVGDSPFTSKVTTTTTVQIVPVIVTIDGHTFDPTKPDHTCDAGKVPLTQFQQSPLVLPAKFTLNGVNVARSNTAMRSSGLTSGNPSLTTAALTTTASRSLPSNRSTITNPPKA